MDHLRCGGCFVAQPSQCGDELCHVLEAVLRVLLEALGHNAIDLVRHEGIERTGKCRTLLEDRGERFSRRRAVKGALAGERLVQDTAEGEDVARRVGVFTTRLFR